MSHNQVDRQIAEAEGKLVFLLKEIHGTPTFERVQLWIDRMTSGRKLSEFIHDDSVPTKDRATVARSLVDILLTKQFDRLPELAGGRKQNQQTPKNPAPVAKSPKVEAQADDQPKEPKELPAPDELRTMIRREVRNEFADLLERIAKVLRE